MNNIKRLVNKTDVPEDGTCTICCSLMFGPKHEPKLFNPCKHLLCTDCDIKVKDKCPICRSQREGPSTLNRKLKNEIGLLNALCKGHGCSVKGKLRDLSTHESMCFYCEHCCRYCDGYFPTGINHELTCWYKCRYCKEKFLYKDITPKEHEKQCEKFPVCCLSKKFGCRKKVAREELESHLRTCPFHQIRDFLKLKQLQFDKVKLQMLTIQKSEMLVRKEHLEAIVKHQKLLEKYQTLFKEHVKLMEKMKNETKKERDRLLQVKKSRGTEVKYIKLSEQFMSVGEKNKELQERILSTDQQLRRDAIKTAMSKNRSKEFNHLLEEFYADAKVQYQLYHTDLQRTYKNFLTIHEDRIKEQFETILSKSGELFIALYGDVYKKGVGTADAIKTLKDDDFTFLRQYQKLMSNQLTGVGALFSGFIEKHIGIQEKQLEKLSGFLGLTDISSDKDENTLEVVDFRYVAPEVLRSYNIKQLQRKIKLLEGLRDGATPITDEVLRNAFEREPELAIIDSPENPVTDDDNDIKVSPDGENKPVFEVNPSLKLDMNEFRVSPVPSVPDLQVGLNTLMAPLEDEKEPSHRPRQEMTLSDAKEQADEKQALPQNYSNTLPEPMADNRITRIGSNSLDPPETANLTEHQNRDGRLSPVDVGLGMRPIMLDPTAVAKALQEGSRRLLRIRGNAYANSEEVD